MREFIEVEHICEQAADLLAPPPMEHALPSVPPRPWSRRAGASACREIPPRATAHADCGAACAPAPTGRARVTDPLRRR